MNLKFVTPDRRVPEDICYFTDAAVEAHDLNYDEAFWLRYFCQNPGSMVNGPNNTRPQHPEDLYVSTGEAISRIKKHYLRWWDSRKTSIEHKMICGAVGMSSVRHVLIDTAKYIAETTVIENGESRRFFRAMEADTKIVRSFRPRRITVDGGNHGISVHDWKPCLDQLTPKKQMTDLRSMLDRIATLEEWADSADIIVTPQRRFSDQIYDREERKQIRRGVELLADLIGRDAMLDFMRTRTLDVQGEKFSIRISLEHLKESHGGAKTTVVVGEDEVCNLCIYTPDTPILDHVASMIVHVQAGMEDDLIKTGNPYSVRVTEKTGIEVLDNRIFPEWHGIEREPIIVVDAIMPAFEKVSRLGDSPFTKKLQEKTVRRITNFLYKNYLSGTKMRPSRVRYSYPRNLNRSEFFNVPLGLVLRSETLVLGLDPLTRALIEDDQGHGEAAE